MMIPLIRSPNPGVEKNLVQERTGRKRLLAAFGPWALAGLRFGMLPFFQRDLQLLLDSSLLLCIEARTSWPGGRAGTDLGLGRWGVAGLVGHKSRRIHS